MDTSTLAAGTAPAPIDNATPVPAPATPVVATAPATARDIVGALTSAERQLLGRGQKSLKEIIEARPAPKGAAPSTAAPVPLVAAPADPVADTPAAQEAAATPEENDDDGDDLKKMRVTPNDFQEREVIRLMKAKRDAQGNVIEAGLGLLQACSKVYGATTPAAAATPGTPPVKAEPAADAGLQGLDSQLATLGESLTKLAKDRDAAREDVDNKKADELSDQIADIRADLKLLNHEREGYIRNRDAQAAHSVEQQVTFSRDRAFDQYPELKVADGMSRLALDGYVGAALNDPNRARFFADPTWPEKITQEFATRHGLKKAGSAATTPVAAPTTATKAAPSTTLTPALRPKPQQVPGAKLVSGADGTPSSAPAAKTLEDLRAAIPGMSSAQRRELFRRISAKAGTR